MLPLSQFIGSIENFLWKYLSIYPILIIGIYLTLHFKFAQITKFYSICKYFFITCIYTEKHSQNGLHPIKAFFTSIGGCIGIGNIIAICTAIKIGGPGALFWVWIAAFFGMIFKYSEVYLGIIYRVKNSNGTFNGGPMFFLQKAFNTQILPYLAAALLAIYGTEFYIFNTLTSILTKSFYFPKWIAITVLLISIISVTLGGIKFVASICGAIIPFFLLIFITMCLFVLLKNISNIPSIIINIFLSAFSQNAEIGGFTGSTIMLTASQGLSRGCYSGDIGIGFASVIHAESFTKNPKKQASFAILGVFLDTFIICTISVLLILNNNLYKITQPELMVQQALSTEIPHINSFMPILILLLGYSSIISFCYVAHKCTNFIFPKNGTFIYYSYAIFIFIILSTIETSTSLSIMSIIGILLLFINSIGIFRLRKKIKI